MVQTLQFRELVKIHQTVYPLSGRGKEIIYKKNNDNFEITWGRDKFKITKKLINDILVNYFIDHETWYPLGASMDQPMRGGLGKFVRDNIKGLSPRHATAIAAVMYNEGFIEVKGKRPIMLRKI